MSMSSQPNPLAADSAFSPAPPPASALRTAFLGPNGLRAGWRILIFIALFAGQGKVLNLVLHRIPAVVAMHKGLPTDVMTAGVLMFDEGLSVALLLLTAFWMTLIERHSFSDYYLPPKEAFGKRFWQGMPYGFAMLSLLMAIIAALHGFSIQGLASAGSVAMKFALLYGIGFFFVGMAEEFLMRGYMQFTLGSGIGFWPAALVLSLLFGLGHIQNIGEDWFGAVMAGSFGILAAFALFRTGNIWFAIGMHLGWDWGETFFYGVPDSGFKGTNYLLNGTLNGPHWISGGSVGPEGSAFALIVLAIGAVGIHFLFPAKQEAA
ncbi:MAG: CPBP family glutamic-type intramembrane protease [Candidatus Acidiferrales bacterium]